MLAKHKFASIVSDARNEISAQKIISMLLNFGYGHRAKEKSKIQTQRRIFFHLFFRFGCGSSLPLCRYSLVSHGVISGCCQKYKCLVERLTQLSMEFAEHFMCVLLSMSATSERPRRK